MILCRLRVNRGRKLPKNKLYNDTGESFQVVVGLSCVAKAGRGAQNVGWFLILVPTLLSFRVYFFSSAICIFASDNSQLKNGKFCFTVTTFCVSSVPFWLGNIHYCHLVVWRIISSYAGANSWMSVAGCRLCGVFKCSFLDKITDHITKSVRKTGCLQWRTESSELSSVFQLVVLVFIQYATFCLNVTVLVLV